MTAVASGARPSRRWLDWLAASRAWLFLVLLVLGFEVWARTAFSASFVFNPFNIASIAVFAVAPLLLAMGQTLVIISGGIDLSVGFTMGLSAVIAAHAANLTAGAGTLPALALGILAGLVIAVVPGVINGFLVAWLRIPPFIGTLGMYGVARGAAYLLAGGTTVPTANTAFAALGNGSLLGIPATVLVLAAVLIVVHLLLSETRFGQHVYAIGGNPEAALRAGIPVRRRTLMIYVISALTAGAAGILYTARFSAGAAQAGEPLLLDSIAAVVIGGASLFGGSGTIIGTLIGALTVAVIQYGLVFINVEPFWQFVAVGVVIILSVLVDQARRGTGVRR